MKINLSIEVPDSTRMYIAQLATGGPPAKKTKSGMATREAVRYWVQQQVNAAADGYVPRPKVSVLEQREIVGCVAGLRAAGWNDDRIRRFILTNRAMLEAVGFKWVEGS